MRKNRAFTLVELLVVIGIIAVLISVLLPALSSARRQANAVKCAAALRELGTAFTMYGADHRGYAPPAKTVSNYTITFNSSPPVDYTAAQYWPNFLAKYITRARLGTSSTSADDRAQARNSLVFGCPAFEKYNNAGYTGGINMVQTGYGMNAFPEYTASFPAAADPPNVIGDSGFSPTLPNAIAVVSTTDNWKSLSAGTWYKLRAWTRPSERALVSDARLWLLEVQAAPLNGSIPPQPAFTDQTFWNSGVSGQTGYDFYRHGTYPKAQVGGTGGYFAATGGKVAYNVLFADGHVSTLSSREEGYKVGRMRYPG